MKEIIELSVGDLYRTSEENTTTDNIRNWIPATGIYNERCELISKLAPNSVVLLIDDRYFYIIYSAISDDNIFIPCKDLERAKRYASTFEVYVKVASNNMIGYINTVMLFPVEQQS